MGYTVSELISNYTINDLKNGGCTAIDLRNLGYSYITLNNLGYSTFDITTAYNIDIGILEILFYT
jgi:hypothetical protein